MRAVILIALAAALVGCGPLPSSANEKAFAAGPPVRCVQGYLWNWDSFHGEWKLAAAQNGSAISCQ